MIILASKSKARQAILKNLGIKFKVLPPRVKEKRDIRGTSPSSVAKENALLKARDVAGRLTGGIVIGCDTLVEQGGKIYGKPKNLSDAVKMLKRLTSKPQNLYTGVAVIDVERKKEVLGCEKTRIIMEKLSDKEIKRYFRKVNPLDKAGAFDIQGLGGLFIKHIEGCYFNVVGLPIAKLYRLLKKVGVSLLLFFCSLAFFGCTTEFNTATGRQDWTVYSLDREVSLGDAISKQVEKDYRLVLDPGLNERVRTVGEKIAAVCDRKALLYRFRIIDKKEEDKEEKEIINAFALPGGYVYVFKDLVKEAETDDELACVLAHEVAHIVARHGIKRLQAIWGFGFLTILAAGTQDADFVKGAQAAYVQILMGYSQEDELLADQLGARYAKRAGYDPMAMITFLKKIRTRHKKEDPRPLSYYRSHPYISHRIRATKEEIGEEISFDDFINSL